MEEKKYPDKTPDTQRLEALKRLPTEILDIMTRAEIQAFLHDEIWPDSLREKLKDFMEDAE